MDCPVKYVADKLDKLVVQEAQGELFSSDWLQFETTLFMVEFPTRSSNCALVVMFIQPWEIQLVWNPHEVRMSKPGTTWSARVW